MAVFSMKLDPDWCHICGTNQRNNVEVMFPYNAEHEAVVGGEEVSGCREREYIRICADCGEMIVRVGRGQIEEAVRNNPALVTPWTKGISPYFKPDFN